MSKTIIILIIATISILLLLLSIKSKEHYQYTTDADELGLMALSTDKYGNIAPTATVPYEGIIMWGGSADNVPEGWKICDGREQTPDLTSRFVMGYDESKTNEKGGEFFVELKMSEMPRHNHGDQVNGGSTNVWTMGVQGKAPAPGDNKFHNQGDSLPHNNTPPFYVLAFIMRKPL